MSDDKQLSEIATPKVVPIKSATSGLRSGLIDAMTPHTLDDAFRLAKALSMSGDMIPKHFQGKPEAIMSAMMQGASIGLAPMQALQSIAVVNGRATIWGDALPALVVNAGHFVDVEVTGEGDAAIATATLTRKDGKKVVRTFSMSDAKKAGLAGKAGPWTQYPKRMLSMRARAWAVRDGAPDALMGLAVAEEVQDYGPDSARDVTPRQAAPRPGRHMYIEDPEPVIDAEPAPVAALPPPEREPFEQLAKMIIADAMDLGANKVEIATMYADQIAVMREHFPQLAMDVEEALK